MPMLAWTDPNPQSVNAGGIVLLLLLLLCAFFVSPLTILQADKRNRLLLALPPVTFVCWFMATFLIGSHQDETWKLYAGSCCAFGIGFSLDIFRNHPDVRGYGLRCLIGYCLLLLITFYLVPVMAST